MLSKRLLKTIKSNLLKISSKKTPFFLYRSRFLAETSPCNQGLTRGENIGSSVPEEPGEDRGLGRQPGPRAGRAREGGAGSGPGGLSGQVAVSRVKWPLAVVPLLARPLLGCVCLSEARLRALLSSSWDSVSQRDRVRERRLSGRPSGGGGLAGMGGSPGRRPETGREPRRSARPRTTTELSASVHPRVNTKAAARSPRRARLSHCRAFDSCAVNTVFIVLVAINN